MTIFDSANIAEFLTDRPIGTRVSDPQVTCYEAIVRTKDGEVVVLYYWHSWVGRTPWRSNFQEERPDNLNPHT